MNVVDSSAWIEFFVQGPNSKHFRPAIHNTDDLLVPSITLLEVFKWTSKRSGRDHALRAVAAMRQGTVVNLDESLALQAAELGLQHRLPLADSVIYATARRGDAVLWTQDADFEGLEGVRYVATAD